jgi:cytidylate kinase
MSKVIAIDGPAGSGKSSTAKAVARILGIVHLDTGAMYRAITLKCLKNGIRYDDAAALKELMQQTTIAFTGTPPDCRTILDGEDVSTAIRGDEVTKNVSDYCAPLVVREALVDQQRKIGSVAACVCEGRDIGTVVFTDAVLKVFMVASSLERARRRQKDFEKLGVQKAIAELEAEIIERDRKDSTRQNSPLVRAPDAELLDTTALDFNGQVDWIVKRAQARGF